MKKQFSMILFIVSILFLTACSNNIYVMSFDSNGGSNISPIAQRFDVSITEPTPTKEGYSFKGWFQDETLSKQYHFNKMPADDMTLYAKWDLNQYTIEFNSNSGSEVQPITQEYNTTITKPDDPVKEGYTFTGWYEEPSLITEYAFDKMPAEDMTLYAKWNANQYTISFNSNNGSEVQSIKQDYNTIITKPNNPVKEGYTFDGWYQDDELTETYNFATMPKEDVTLYAKWNANQYSIHFYTHGGSDVQAIIQNYNTNITIPTEPIKEGYSFVGWFKDTNYTEEYTSTTMPNEDMTLHAKWNINEYTIDFNSNGGSEIPSITQEYNTIITKPEEPIKEDYTFEGWYYDETLTKEFMFDKMPAKDMTLHAKWSERTYSSIEIYEMASQSTYEVMTYDKDGNELSIGTGFFITDDGKLITNYHVIEDAYSAKIKDKNGRIYDVDLVLGYDKNLDIAILKINNLTTIPLKLTERINPTGAEVYALGSSMGLSGTFSEGIISKSTRVYNEVMYVQITAPISPGNSGGPVINIYGEVIGINTLSLTDGDNIYFSVKVSQISKVDQSNPKTMEEVYYENLT